MTPRFFLSHFLCRHEGFLFLDSSILDFLGRDQNPGLDGSDCQSDFHPHSQMDTKNVRKL